MMAPDDGNREVMNYYAPIEKLPSLRGKVRLPLKRQFFLP